MALINRLGNMDSKAISQVVDDIVRTVAGQSLVNPRPGRMVPIGVSNRHGHLTKEHAELLFGPGARLTSMRELKQPGQFATNETLSVATVKSVLPRVRLIGPERKESQIELSKSEAIQLGLDPPVRDSGAIESSPGCVLLAPAGAVVLTRGVILAARHMHCHTSEADALGLKDKQIIRIRVHGPRGGVLENVMVRVHPEFRLELHLDTDEANALGVKNGDLAEILK